MIRRYFEWTVKAEACLKGQQGLWNVADYLKGTA